MFYIVQGISAGGRYDHYGWYSEVLSILCSSLTAPFRRLSPSWPWKGRWQRRLAFSLATFAPLAVRVCMSVIHFSGCSGSSQFSVDFSLSSRGGRMLVLSLRSLRSNSLWNWLLLLAFISLQNCFGRTIESILTVLSLSSVSLRWNCDLALYLLSDCVETLTFSWQLLFSSASVGSRCSVAAAMPRVLQSGARSQVNLGGRYLCSSQSFILAMMRPYASTLACGGTASPISYSRWV